MSFYRKMAGACLGLALSTVGLIGTASAQYNRGYDREPEYDRRERYERRERSERRDDYDRRGSDRRGDYDNRQGRGGYQGDGRGYGQGQQQGARPGAGRGNNPLAGMSLEDQKRAIKNQREAQKKLIKRGYVPQ